MYTMNLSYITYVLVLPLSEYTGGLPQQIIRIVKVLKGLLNSVPVTICYISVTPANCCIVGHELLGYVQISCRYLQA